MCKFLLVSPLFLEGRSWLCLILNLNSSAKLIPFSDGQTERAQRAIGKPAKRYLEEGAGRGGVI